MKVGGNKKMLDFFAQQRFPPNLSIEQKYTSEAATLYRDRIKQLAEGKAESSLPSIPIVGYQAAEPKPTPHIPRSRSGDEQLLQSVPGSQQSNTSTGRMKMEGFGSTPAPSSSSSSSAHAGANLDTDAFFSSLSSSLASAARRTGAAAAALATKGREAAAVIGAKTAEQARELHTQDMLASAAQSAASGWRSLSSFVSGALQHNTAGGEFHDLVEHVEHKPTTFQGFGGGGEQRSSPVQAAPTRVKYGSLSSDDYNNNNSNNSNNNNNNYNNSYHHNNDEEQEYQPPSQRQSQSRPSPSPSPLSPSSPSPSPVRANSTTTTTTSIRKSSSGNPSIAAMNEQRSSGESEKKGSFDDEWGWN